MAFHVLEVALQLIHEVRGAAGRIAARDSDLGKQLTRAASSIALNVSEGRQRAGKDRAYHYRVAAGSAAETRTALRLAVAWGHVDDAAIADALASLDRIAAMLHRLVNPR